jgi:CRISPR-associated protein Csa3
MKSKKKILRDVNDNYPTTITKIAERLNLSESTVSRQVARLADQKALHLTQIGKMKEVRITLTGKILL